MPKTFSRQHSDQTGEAANFPRYMKVLVEKSLQTPQPMLHWLIGV